MYCQQTLCTSALFEDLILFLIKKDSGVNLKRMSVYVILVLVSNNSKFSVLQQHSFSVCQSSVQNLEHLISNVLVNLIYKDECLHVTEPELSK